MNRLFSRIVTRLNVQLSLRIFACAVCLLGVVLGFSSWRRARREKVAVEKAMAAPVAGEATRLSGVGAKNVFQNNSNSPLPAEMLARFQNKRRMLQEGRYDQPGEAMDFFRLKRLPEGETEIPLEKYFAAEQRMERMPQYSFAEGRVLPSRGRMTKEAAALPAWTSLGPGNIGGRTRALVISPAAPDTMYAAGVAGGVWKTTNGGTSWTPVADLLANLAVSSLAMDPSNANVLYAGTGEGFFNGDAQRGAGIFKTTDGGATWTRLAGTTAPDFYYVNDIVVSPNAPLRVYAATRTGIWRSTDGGGAWTRVLNATSVGSTTAAISGGCLDLAIRTDRPTDYIFASCGTFEQSRIFRNTDAGAAGQWLQVHTEPGMGRASLALAPSNQGTVYALTTALTGPFANAMHAVFRSTANGDAGTWDARVRNTDANKLNKSLLSFAVGAFAVECGFDSVNFFSGQGWYDNVIAVDPLDPNRVWAAGIDMFRSDDGGANWGLAAHAYLERNIPQYVHPDHHVLVFHPQYNGTTNQTLFAGNDGGLYRTNNARASTATGAKAACSAAPTTVNWTSLNNGYGVTQFYHGLPYPNGMSYFGGTQDNGTLRGTDGAGANAWQEILDGDGGYVAVDPTNPNVIYAERTGISIHKSTDGGATFTRATTGISDGGLFISPFVMDMSNPQRLFTGGIYIWRTTNAAANWTRASALTAGTGSVSALAVAPTNANFALAGMSDGFILRTDIALTSNANTTWASTRPRTGFVSWVAFDPTNKDIAYATYSTFDGAHVWKTTNAGVSWTAIDGTGAGALPNVPVHSVVVDSSNTSRLYIGTDVGVFATTDGGANWVVENTGFANVITESLALNVVNGVTQLFAFTHGRGAWRVTANQSGCDYALTPAAQDISAAGGNGTINVTAQPAGCNWTAVSNAPWITVNSGASGSGNGSIAFTVAANTTTASRTGTISAAGKTFTLTQAACTSIAPAFQYFESAGGPGSITVTATGGCAWAVTGTPNWVTVNSGASGSGNGMVTFTVAANTGATSRQAVMTVAGQSFTVIQGGSGGSCAVTPITQGQIINGALSADDCRSLLRGEFFFTDRYSFTGTAGQRVAIRAESSAVDTYLYLVAPGGAVVAENDDAENITNARTSARIPAGTGFFTLPANGVYQIEVTSFSSNSAVGAYSLSLSTGSPNCSYAVAPAAQSVAAGGGAGTVINVTAGAGCAWMSSAGADWITINTGAVGSGNGAVTFNVAPNTGLTRTASLIVAGQLVTITQFGAAAATPGLWATQAGGTTNQLNHVFFLTDTQGWTVGANSTARATSNGGTNWNGFTVGGSLQTYNSVRFFDANNGWVGGERLFAQTSSGGSGWIRSEPTAGTRHRLFPTGSFNAWTVGERDGGGLHTRPLLLDFGFTVLAQEALSLSTLNTLRDIYFPNPDNGWSVGDNGQIYRLTKGGGAFDTQTGNTAQNLNGVFMLDLCTGWAVGDQGLILKTVNGGADWVSQSAGTTANLRDVHFVNVDRGWAVGDGGVILTTVNGGTTWTAEVSGTTANLRGVHFSSAIAGYAVGANGVIVKRSQCNYSLSATTAEIAFGGGNGSVNVTTAAGCPWTATTNAPWITINSGATGTGNGTVAFTVAANTGPARTGTIIIADRNFTVSQTAAPVQCPTVTALGSASGFVGRTVTITGTNFNGVTAVRFNNNVAAQFTVNSATQIVATIPAGATTGPITISKTGCTDVLTAAFTVQVCPTITVNPATLPDAAGGAAYSQTLTATGGVAPHGFAVTAGALPNGLTLAAGGALSGTPNAAGAFNFTVTATDANGCTGTRSYTLNVTAPSLDAQTRALYVLHDCNGCANQIYGYAVNESTGALTLLPGFPVSTGGNGGSGAFSERLTIDRRNQRLYAVNDSTDNVSAFAINPTTGALTALPFSPISLGSGAWATVAVHPSGSPLIVGDSLPANRKVASIVITASTATPALGSPFNTGSAAAFSAAFSQDGSFLYVGGNAFNNFFAGFSVSPATGVLTALSGSPFSSGAVNPLAYATDVSGRLFLANVDAGQVRALTTAGGVPSDVSGNPFASGLTAATHGVLHPNGFYLAADRGNIAGGAAGGRIGVYKINGSGSATTLAAVSGSPFNPSATEATVLALNQTGSLLFAADGNARNLKTLSVNPSTGALTLSAAQLPGAIGGAGRLNGMAYFAPPCETVSLTPVLPAGMIGAAYSQTVSAAPAGTYNYSVTVGALPAGLTLNAATGLISGTPVVTGTANFTITALGFGGCTGSQTYSVNIRPLCPTITNVNPAGAPVGATVTITGTNFNGVTQVRFSGVSANFTIAGDTQITATVPAGAVSGSLTVGKTDCQDVSANFTVIVCPTVTSLSVAGGIVGSSVTINGSGFAGVNAVRFANPSGTGAAAQFTVVSDTQINATVPAGAVSGPITISETGCGDVQTAAFTVIVCPTISGIAPNAAPVGTQATISGSGFTGVTAVRFSENVSATFNVVSDTTITLTVPAGAVTGPVAVTKPGCTDTTVNFTVVVCPTITGVAPTTATVGKPVTINGSGLMGVSAVRFANNVTAQFNVVSDTQITATVPNGAVDGPVTISETGCADVQTAALTILLDTPRLVRVANMSGAPGSLVAVPIELIAQGNENALGLSLTFDTALLSNPQAALGSDAAGGQINSNVGQVGQGRFGLVVSLGTGQRFSAETRQVAVVTFTIAANAAAGTTPIGFGNQPIAREISDTEANILPANYAAGTVTIAPGYEADVAPRPNGTGDGTVTTADWVLVGRFAAGLDTPALGNEFQRADCAPKNNLGDGRLTINDWVQAGRYAAGLDPVVLAGGPTMPAASVIGDRQSVLGSPAQTLRDKASTVRAQWEIPANHQPPTANHQSLAIELDGWGGENALGFSLQFNPAQWRFVSARVGRDAAGAVLHVNATELAAGRIGIALAMPAGESFAAGTKQVALLRFAPVAGRRAAGFITFGDQPLARELADVNAQPIPAEYAVRTDAVTANRATVVSAADFRETELAAESIASAFGTGLATATLAAESLPLPFDLAGTRVTVTDGEGIERPAPLFFVSPAQINFLIPAGTAEGPAWVTITGADGKVSVAAMQIAATAPALFTATADGQGIASAIVLRQRADGSQQFQPVARFDPTLNRVVALPVNAAAPGEQVFLILFGTGLRHGHEATATLGGQPAEVLFVGPAPGYAGLDQCNLRLPRLPTGRGEMELRLTLDGKTANSVRLLVN